MAHRIGGGTWDLYLSAQLEIRSGLPVGIEIWGRQLTTRGGEIGVPKGGGTFTLNLQPEEIPNHPALCSLKRRNWRESKCIFPKRNSMWDSIWS